MNGRAADGRVWGMGIEGACPPRRAAAAEGAGWAQAREGGGRVGARRGWVGLGTGGGGRHFVCAVRSARRARGRGAAHGCSAAGGAHHVRGTRGTCDGPTACRHAALGHVRGRRACPRCTCSRACDPRADAPYAGRYARCNRLLRPLLHLAMRLLLCGLHQQVLHAWPGQGRRRVRHRSGDRRQRPPQLLGLRIRWR